jgi:mannose/fructose/N-acetylgalactosamine-specific phosphotransferase system component IIC
MKTPLNKVIYVGFLLIGFYQAFFSKDYMQAAASLGIGMAFDPFNPDQKWNERPSWQKGILIVQIGLVAALFGLGIGLNDK